MPDHYPQGIQPETLAHLAQVLDEHFTELHGRRLGFALLVFEMGTGEEPPGARFKSGYVSNAERDDMIRMLREQARALEMKMDTPPGGQAPGLN